MADITIIDYSDKAIAVAMERDCVFDWEFNELGGRFNSRLKFGAGWIFSRKKSAERLRGMLEHYGLSYASVDLSDIVTSVGTSDKEDRNGKPGYILTDTERKEWIKTTFPEYIHKDHIKNYAVCVRLADGGILPIESGALKTEFWFGESDFGQGPTSEEASAAAEYASTNEDYFINENLDKFRSMLKGLRNESDDIYKHLYLYTCGDGYSYKYWSLKWSNLNPQSTNWVDFLDRWERELYDKGEFRPLTDDDRERLIAGYELALQMREKRCRAYLKRYGLSKISARTYWMDR